MIELARVLSTNDTTPRGLTTIQRGFEEVQRDFAELRHTIERQNVRIAELESLNRDFLQRAIDAEVHRAALQFIDR